MKRVLISLAAMAFATAANAQVLTNGGFSSTSPSGNGQLNYSGYTITGWTGPSASSNYDFIFTPSATNTSGTTADGPGANGIDGNVQLWGPDNGSPNGLTESPQGGNFLAVDPSYQNGGPISTTVTGLTKGDTYAVSFYYAGAEQEGPNFKSATTEGWTVGFGSDPTQSTALLNNAGEGFTGWNQETFDFVATGSSDVLSFLAYGGTGDNAAIPPFALLDGVSVSAIPEPATWAMMLLGFGALGTAIRSRRKQALATA